MFIEVNVGKPTRSIISEYTIKKIVPVVNGEGCVIHFDSGTLNIAESYEEILGKLVNCTEKKKS